MTIQSAVSGKRGTKANEIYSTIYDAVMNHRLLPGTKLPEATFSSYFGVSRTTFRKALNDLSQNKIVEMQPNKCAVVACPTRKETHEIFDARRLLESHAIRTLFHKKNSKITRKLKELAEQELKFETAGDRRSMLKVSTDFHMIIAENAGNSILTRMLTSLITRTTLITALYYSSGASPCPTHDHSGLVDLIVSGDEEGAVLSMCKHLDNIENQLDFSSQDDELDLEAVLGKR